MGREEDGILVHTQMELDTVRNVMSSEHMADTASNLTGYGHDTKETVLFLSSVAPVLLEGYCVSHCLAML